MHTRSFEIRLPGSGTLLQTTSSGDCTLAFLAGGAIAAAFGAPGGPAANAAPQIGRRSVAARAVTAVRIMISIRVSDLA
jgi:hypothetical protein